MIESVLSASSVPAHQPKRRVRKERKRVSGHYDALLRRLQLIEDGKFGEGPCAIGVTSCQSREGVTTVAVNLAVAVANSWNRPTLLVDANVKRPSLHKIFRLKMTDGLIGATMGETGLFDSIVESKIENLSVLPAGRPHSGGEPVYEARTVEEALEGLKHVFPLIVFDLPPATEFTTCFVFAGKLDGVVLVIEARRVNRAVAERAKRRFCEANANLAGVVFNKFS